MARPTNTPEWASAGTAQVSEPSLSFKQSGFTEDQPSNDHLNWAIQNLYQWYSFFDQNIGGGGGITLSFNADRPRIQLPFEIDTDIDPPINAIDVFKRGESRVGGISDRFFSASGAVTGPSEEGSSSATTYGTDSRLMTYHNRGGPRRIYCRGGPYPSQLISRYQGGWRLYNPSRLDSYSFPQWTFPGIQSYANFHPSQSIWQDNTFRMSIVTRTYLTINSNLQISGGEIIASTGGSISLVPSDFSAQISTVLNNTWLIAAATQSDISAGRCVVWSFSGFVVDPEVPGDWDRNAELPSGGIAPVYSNAAVASLRNWYFVSSFSQTPSAATGSARASALPALSGSPGYGMASYAYDPAANTVTVVMSGTVTGSSFHTFKIKSGTQDLTTLLSANAVFTAGTKTFVWSNIATDPISSAGTYTFEFAGTGTGLPAYSFTRLTSGLAIETYGGARYLHISSGAATGDVLFIRPKTAA